MLLPAMDVIYDLVSNPLAIGLGWWLYLAQEKRSRRLAGYIELTGVLFLLEKPTPLSIDERLALYPALNRVKALFSHNKMVSEAFSHIGHDPELKNYLIKQVIEGICLELKLSIPSDVELPMGPSVWK